MTLAALANLADVIGAFGVIAGLVFVGIQLRQNTLQLQRAEKNATNSEASILRQAIFSDGDLAELLSACVRQTRPLDPIEVDRMSLLFWEMGFQLIQFWERTQHGLFKRQEFESLAPMYAPYFTSAFGLEWWRQARLIFRPDFVVDVEHLMPILSAPVAVSPVVESAA